MAEGDLGSDGVFVGQDLYSGDSFVYDPWVLYACFGQENFQHEEEGSFTKLDPSFGNLVLHRATAERAFKRFTKSDPLVSEDYDYTYERGGQTIAREEFFAKKIGHDTARTRYDVDRTPRHAMNRDAAGQAFEPTRQSAPAPTGLSMCQGLDESDFVPEPDYPGILDDQPDMFDANALPEPPHPINWNLLPTQDLEAELLELNRWGD